MTSRDKVLASLNHQDGPVPIDFGSNAVTGMHVSCVEALRRHFGLDQHPVKVIEPYQMLGEIEDDLKQVLGVDVEGVWPQSTIFGFANRDWKPWRTPWGQDVLMSGEFRFKTEGDSVYVYAEGDTRFPPSAHLPGGGYFFDAIIRQGEFDEDNPSVDDNLQEYAPVTDAALTYFATESAKAKATGRAVLSNFGGTALGDIALVTGPMLPQPRGIRDITEWYVSTVARQDFVRELFDRQTTLAVENLKKLAKAVGDNVDAVFMCGTDFGTQTSQFCSAKTFDEVWAPYYRRMNDWIHANTKWKTFKHCCGSILPLVPGLLDAGFDILNPVQCSATDMDPVVLKQRFGDRVVFWGGGVDTQQVLPFGTPAQVRAQVLERCRTFSPGGGFVFDAIHNVQAKTPVANIVAMVEAVREFNQKGQ